MGLNVKATAPWFPLIPKLWSMITQNSLRKPAHPLQCSYGFSRRQLMVKLLSTNNKAAKVIDADQKPVAFTPTVNGPLKSICHSSRDPTNKRPSGTHKRRSYYQRKNPRICMVAKEKRQS
jgi:hypothetical protein